VSHLKCTHPASGSLLSASIMQALPVANVVFILPFKNFFYPINAEPFPIFDIPRNLSHCMRYLHFLLALDLLYKYYPKFHSNELLILADDIWKWVNNELPEDSSTLVYLQSCFDSPYEAFKAVIREIELLAGPYFHWN